MQSKVCLSITPRDVVAVGLALTLLFANLVVLRVLKGSLEAYPGAENFYRTMIPIAVFVFILSFMVIGILCGKRRWKYLLLVCAMFLVPSWLNMRTDMECYQVLVGTMIVLICMVIGGLIGFYVQRIIPFSCDVSAKLFPGNKFGHLDKPINAFLSICVVIILANILVVNVIFSQVARKIHLKNEALHKLNQSHIDQLPREIERK